MSHGRDQATAFLVWLFADQTRERLRGELRAQRERETRDGLLVLSAADRAKRLATVDERILAAEREEEWLIRAAEQEGATIDRREKANPLAILGICVVSRSRAKNAAALKGAVKLPRPATLRAGRERAAACHGAPRTSAQWMGRVHVCFGY